MSRHSTKTFIARMKSDAAFRHEVLTVEGADARLAYVAAEGYEVTAAEIAELAGALRDVDLGPVTGGVGDSCPTQGANPCDSPGIALCNMLTGCPGHSEATRGAVAQGSLC